MKFRHKETGEILIIDPSYMIGFITEGNIFTSLTLNEVELIQDQNKPLSDSMRELLGQEMKSLNVEFKEKS